MELARCQDRAGVAFLYGQGHDGNTAQLRAGYDLTERVIPPAVLARPTPSQEEAQRELVRIAARALGVATERDLRDYFHLPSEQSKARVAELAEAGELVPVRIEGLAPQMYLWDPPLICA
jgi:uncharacterized protein